MSLQRTKTLSTLKLTDSEIQNYKGRRGELVMVSHSNGVKLHLMDGITNGGLVINTSTQRPEGGEENNNEENEEEENSTPPAPTPVIATGGTMTSYTDSEGKEWNVHTYTSSGSFEVTNAGEIEYLVVAGGGGGGDNTGGGGGGGAGGVLLSCSSDNDPNYTLLSPLQVSAQTYTITVGAGGSNDTNGEDSSIGTELVAKGGGSSTSSGGSGAGAEWNRRTPGSGEPGQGNDGGNDAGQGSYGNWFTAGGGGGAGTPGHAARSVTLGGVGVPTYYGGNGGDGIQSLIQNGTDAVYYGGGGGGGSMLAFKLHYHWDSENSAGGLGGGGIGKGVNKGNGENGIDGTGGGGGAGSNGTIGGNGGSGIVIIRYQTNI